MKILKWIFCIPAGLLAGLLVGLVYMVLNDSGEPESIYSYINAVFGGTLSGLATAYVSARVAPSHRRIVACVMILVGLISFLLPTHDADKVFITYTFCQELGIVALSIWILLGRLSFES